MYGIPNCVPEYYRSKWEDEAHEAELEMERQSWYEKNKAYRLQKRKDGCAEIDCYPDECHGCKHGEEANPYSEYDDMPTMICSNWKACHVFKKYVEEHWSDTPIEEVYSWFEYKEPEMEKRTYFKLIFKDKYGDFRMALCTTEPHTEKEIKELIEAQKTRLLNDGYEDYSPIDIIDGICEEKGWDWEDADYQEMVIEDWK